MAKIFDGKEFSLKKLEFLKKEVIGLKSKGIFPHLASIIVGDNPASKLYVGLKKKAGEKIGIEVSIYYLPKSVKKEEILTLIKTLNEDKFINGIMLQLPLPENLSGLKDEIISLIDPEKDVDGLRLKSRFVHPTAMAVFQIIEFAKSSLKIQLKSITVVGQDGMVGKSLVKEIKNTKFKLTNDSKEADIVVSATGKENLIKAYMIKSDAVIIDVGSPKGDVDFKDCQKLASFITPVPGGVGPVTITCLLENMVIACNK